MCYEILFGTVDASAIKNWLNRVSNTLIDMELDNELKLILTTRLMDKNDVIWWGNLKLRDLKLFCTGIQ